MGSYDEKKGNPGERFAVILTPSLTLFYSFLVLLGKLLNVACPEDIHSGDTVDQREVQPEQDQRIKVRVLWVRGRGMAHHLHL